MKVKKIWLWNFGSSDVSLMQRWVRSILYVLLWFNGIFLASLEFVNLILGKCLKYKICNFQYLYQMHKMYLKVSKGIWRCIKVSEGIWRPFKVSDSIWMYLEALEGFWRYLQVFAGIKRYLKLSEFWRHFNVFEGFWKYLYVFVLPWRDNLLNASVLFCYWNSTFWNDASDYDQW